MKQSISPLDGTQIDYKINDFIKSKIALGKEIDITLSKFIKKSSKLKAALDKSKETKRKFKNKISGLKKKHKKTKTDASLSQLEKSEIAYQDIAILYDEQKNDYDNHRSIKKAIKEEQQKFIAMERIMSSFYAKTPSKSTSPDVKIDDCKSLKVISGADIEVTGHSRVSAHALKGKRVVLYFYPRDNTPGCTIEGQNFSQYYNQFAKYNTVVLGVSRDSVETHEKFKDKHDFPFELVSDHAGKLCERFNVIKEKNVSGKKVKSIERSTFLFNEKGKLCQEWRKVKVGSHVTEVLDHVKNM